MTKHSPEPWTSTLYSGPAPNFCAYCITAKDRTQFVAAVAGETHKQAEANLIRITACINYCEGLSLDQLVRGRNGIVYPQEPG